MSEQKENCLPKTYMNYLEKEMKPSFPILAVRRFCMPTHPSGLLPLTSSPLGWVPWRGNERALSLRQCILDALFSFHSVIRLFSQKPFSFLYNYIPFPYSFQVWLISKVFPHFCCLLPWLILVGSVPLSLWGPDVEHGKRIKV